MALSAPARNWFATRLRLEWSPELQARADAAGIRLFRAWPPASIYWRAEWGAGNVFVGRPDDPAEAVVELPAESAHGAKAKVMRALAVDVGQFIVSPEWCPAAAVEARVNNPSGTGAD